MRIACEICGAYTEDKEIIQEFLNNKRNRICPECLHIGSLYIDRTDHQAEKGGGE